MTEPRTVCIRSIQPGSWVLNEEKLEIAENFKSQGNDYFKGKRYREAMNFYNQGIEAKPVDPKLLEALLCNRAACNLELRTSFTSITSGCN